MQPTNIASVHILVGWLVDDGVSPPCYPYHLSGVDELAIISNGAEPSQDLAVSMVQRDAKPDQNPD